MRGLLVVCLCCATARAQQAPPRGPAKPGNPAGAQGGVTVESTSPHTPDTSTDTTDTSADTTGGVNVTNAANAGVTANGTATANATVVARIPDARVSVAPVFPVHIEYGLDFGGAVMRGEMPTQGYGPMFALPVNVYVTPWLGVGVRGQLVYSPDPARDGPLVAGHADDEQTQALSAWSATAGPRFRIWSDPAARLRWVIDLDAGYVAVPEISPSGPLGRITLGRMVAGFDPRGNGVNGGVTLSAEAGFGAAAPYRAIFGSTWFHGESGIDAATSAGPHDGWFPSTFTLEVPLMLGKNYGEVYGGLPIGIGAAFGVALSELVEPRVRIDTLGLKHHEGDATKMVGGSAGLRLRFDRWARMFLDVYGGYERAFGVEPLRIGSGPFIDIGTGFHSTFCRYAADFGVRLRLGVGEDNDKLATLVLVLAGARGNTESALGRPIKRCGED